jgi:hypothetical protein
MQFKPDELPNMTLDEVRRVTLNLAGVTGANTISSAEATSDTLTVGSTSISGASVSFLVTADQRGTNYILVSAVLSSGETVKGYIRAKVTGAPCGTSIDRYE